MKRTFLLLLLTGTELVATAQPYRTSYAVPDLTDEVRAIRSTAAWEPATPAPAALPRSVDNSRLKYFPAIFSQNGGSCAQSSGIRYLFTYEMNRLLDRDAKASPENTYSYFYTWNFLNEGIDQGGFAEQGLNIARRQGVMSLADFPDPSSYFSFAWASGSERYIRAMRNRVKEIVSFEMTSQEGIDRARRYLYDAGNGSEHGGVLSFSTLATGWSINSNYSGPSETGYKSLLTKLATEGAHAMTIVGYDDTVEFTHEGQTHTGAFIVVNSYGTWWGDNGRVYLPYHFFLQDRPAVILSHDVTGCSCTEHTPQVVFRVRVTYDSRNDLAFTMGVADKPYAAAPTVTLKSAIAANQGGDHPMQGPYSDDNSIEMAFDFTESVPKYASFTEPKYFLTVTRSEVGTKFGSGTIDAFSVIDYRDASGPKEYACELPRPVALEKGANVFSVATTPLVTTSASPVQWLDGLWTPYTTPYAVRTASGRYAKFQITDYDRGAGKVTIRYLYQKDGSRNLNSLTD